jgi:CBS domain-containing protein
MNVSEVMTSNVACCTTTTPLRDVAQLMVDNDCGCIPVTENEADMRVVGVITDRDIACRAVARGADCSNSMAGNYMTASPATVRPDTPIQECERIMEQMRVRRVPVVDQNGTCMGIVSQADIALACGPQDAGQVVQAVSRPYMA